MEKINDDRTQVCFRQVDNLNFKTDKKMNRLFCYYYKKFLFFRIITFIKGNVQIIKLNDKTVFQQTENGDKNNLNVYCD